MSLLKLPPEIIAQICLFAGYRSFGPLLRTSRQIYEKLRPWLHLLRKRYSTTINFKTPGGKIPIGVIYPNKYIELSVNYSDDKKTVIAEIKGKSIFIEHIGCYCRFYCKPFRIIVQTIRDKFYVNVCYCSCDISINIYYIKTSEKAINISLKYFNYIFNKFEDVELYVGVSVCYTHANNLRLKLLHDVYIDSICVPNYAKVKYKYLFKEYHGLHDGHSQKNIYKDYSLECIALAIFAAQIRPRDVVKMKPGDEGKSLREQGKLWGCRAEAAVEDFIRELHGILSQFIGEVNKSARDRLKICSPDEIMRAKKDTELIKKFK